MSTTELPLPGVIGGQTQNQSNNNQQQPSATAAGNNNNNQQEAASLVSGGKVSHSTHAKGKRGKGKGKGGKGKGKGGKSGGGKGGKASGGGKRGGKKAPVSRSTLADLTFPVGRIHSRMKLNLLKKQRCGSTAAIYLTALLEYLTAELLDLSTHACELAGNKRITPRHILLAIKSDKELDQLITATISKGGVQPSGVNRMLLQKGSKAAQELNGGKKASKSTKKSSKKSAKKSSASQKQSSQTSVPQRGKKSAA